MKTTVIMNKSDFEFGTITTLSLLVFQFKNQHKRSARFLMKSVGSCFPNCQISLVDFVSSWPWCAPLLKCVHATLLHHTSSLFHPFIFFSFSCYSSPVFACNCHIVIIIMGMAAEAQFHVLAVDDSVIDRMLIERLLKTSSFHGNFPSLHFVLWWKKYELGFLASVCLLFYVSFSDVKSNSFWYVL